MARRTASGVAAVGSRTAVWALLLLMAGCQSKTAPTKENFTLALNAYYANHDDCLFPGGLRFPYEVSAKGEAGAGGSSIASAKGMDTLMDAGMLTRFEDKTLKVNRYSLTAAGSRAAPRFCYGHRVVTSIESASEPAKVNGFPETLVEYSYSIIDVPLWAKSEAVESAFPEMAKAVRGQAQGKTRLSQTMAGWQVPE